MISYTTLVAVAVSGGLGYPWAWAWPLCLDSFMTIASLDVIRREMNGEPTLPAWIVVITVTLVSTGFNITRADPSIISWGVHALAPLVCFLSFEIEMGVLRSYFRSQENDIPDNVVKAPIVNVVTPDVKTASVAQAPVVRMPVPEIVRSDNIVTPPVVKADVIVPVVKPDNVVILPIVKPITSMPDGVKAVPAMGIDRPENNRGMRSKIIEYYRTHSSSDVGYAEVARALGTSRQVVRNNVIKLSANELSSNA
jgi:hypothetical protein